MDSLFTYGRLLYDIIDAVNFVLSFAVMSWPLVKQRLFQIE
jgi:hypothetical protein